MISFSAADGSWTMGNEEPANKVRVGGTPDYPVMDILSRPIRPNLITLIVAGFVADNTSYDLLSISQLIISSADTSFELPNGEFGIWGAIQAYDKSTLSGGVAFSNDGFKSLLSGKSIPGVEYKLSSGVEDAIAEGDNDPQAGTGERPNISFRINPASGLAYEETGVLPGIQERNAQFGRLLISVYDAEGYPVPDDAVKQLQINEFFRTDERGRVVLDCVAGTYNLRALRGNLDKTKTVEKFTENELTFRYAGVQGVCNDGQGRAIPLSKVELEEIDGDDHFYLYTDTAGNYVFPWLKPSAEYKVTVMHFWKEFLVTGEATMMLENFNNAKGWNTPAGYPAAVSNAAILVTDTEGQPVYYLPVEIWDENYTWRSRTDLNGQTILVVPATELNVLIDGGKRYVSYAELVDLTTDYSKEIKLDKKVAISIR